MDADEHSRKAMKRQYDKTTADTTFKVGDQVMLKTGLRKKGRCPKLDAKYHGPYTLLEQRSPVTFKLSGLSKRAGKVAHVNRMKLFRSTAERIIRPVPVPNADLSGTAIDTSSSTDVDSGKQMETSSSTEVALNEHIETSLSTSKALKKHEETHSSHDIALSEHVETSFTTAADLSDVVGHSSPAVLDLINDVETSPVSAFDAEPDVLVTPNVFPTVFPFPEAEDHPPGGEINGNVGMHGPPGRVRRILDHRRFHQKLQYLVESSGLELSPAWIGASDLKGDPIVDYYLTHDARRANTRASTRKELDVNTVVVRFPTVQFTWNTTAMWFFFFIIFILLGFRTVSCKLALGPLYNCGVTQYSGVYALPSRYECHRNFDESKLLTYNASVRQYRARETSFFVYHCEAQMVTLRCNTLFFGSREKSLKTRAIPVTKRHCFIAFRTKRTPFGVIRPDGIGRWSTQTRTAYKCKWEREEKTSYVKFTMHRYKVSVIGADRIIHQHITGTACDVRAHFCTPLEVPLSILVWGRPDHTYSFFHTLGIFAIHQMHDYVLISQLGIGGGVIKKTGGLILLDNGYILRLITSQKAGSAVPFDAGTAQFMNFSRNYVSNTTSSVQRELSEGRIASELMRENRLLIRMASILCNTNHKLHITQRLLLKDFPDIDHDDLFGRGKLVEAAGEALLVHSCQRVETYEVFWNQTWNGSCYHLFPVISDAIKPIGFLELSARRLGERSHTIHCDERPPLIFVTDTNNKFWEIKNGAHFRQVKPYAFNHPFGGLVLPKLAGFNNKLLHYTKVRPHRLTLLHLLADQRDNLKDLSNYRTVGAGDIASGIAQALSGTLSFVASTGRLIFKSFANTTEAFIGVSGDSLSKVLHSLGEGVHTAILYFLIFCIVLYLACNHFGFSPFRSLRATPRRELSQAGGVVEPSTRGHDGQSVSPPVPPRIGNSGVRSSPRVISHM